jgi:hypothetical protein
MPSLKLLERFLPFQTLLDSEVTPPIVLDSNPDPNGRSGEKFEWKMIGSLDDISSNNSATSIETIAADARPTDQSSASLALTLSLDYAFS